ncbi:hypothetical protein [Bremerella sp.]|uniref:hypothetical protein n=1 Tax=Bremerella sp. TaxID=2795602 RepID=UPI00391D87B5
MFRATCLTSLAVPFLFLFHGTMLCVESANAADPQWKPVEKDGLLIVEAEAFAEQKKTEHRAFHRISQDATLNISPDGDEAHWNDASGMAYLEVLPDTRRTHADKLIHGENFAKEPGTVAVLSYPVQITNPGRYYVWVRAYSTGSEDNGIHVGLDGEWPESGQRMQWCQGKNSWRWDSKQRTEKNHCGERYKIFLDIKEPGEHTIEFSMREDGFEFDQWLITKDKEYHPEPEANDSDKTS